MNIWCVSNVGISITVATVADSVAIDAISDVASDAASDAIPSPRAFSVFAFIANVVSISLHIFGAWKFVQLRY